MRIIHRLIHQIASDKWGEVAAYKARFAALVQPVGYPPYKWYRVISGTGDDDTLIGYQEYESMAHMGELFHRLMALPGRAELVAEARSVFPSDRHEYCYSFE